VRERDEEGVRGGWVSVGLADRLRFCRGAEKCSFWIGPWAFIPPSRFQTNRLSSLCPLEFYSHETHQKASKALNFLKNR